MKEVILTLKVGRHTYDITEKDLFMDNGACVQLLTQSKETPDWGRIPNPVLSKRAEKELSKYPSVVKSLEAGVSIFGVTKGV